MSTSASRSWTVVGLILALLGIPAITTAVRLTGAAPAPNSLLAIRELLILWLVGVLLWIVTRRERLTLSSIGLRFDRWGRSLGWGFGLAIVLFGCVLVMLVLFHQLGIHYGENSRIAPSLAVTLLAVVRAGMAEETFYRGFAIERLQALTGSKWLAATISLAAFAGFHYRQGLPGIFLAFVLGAILTLFYLWKRDLLAAIIAHFLVDFVPNVLLPLVAGQGS